MSTQNHARERRDLSGRDDLPNWLRTATVFVPCGWREPIEWHDLLARYGRGCEWRSEQPEIAARVQGLLPQAVHETFWDNLPSASDLCWARGAAGLSWEDEPTAISETASGAVEIETAKPVEPVLVKTETIATAAPSKTARQMSLFG